jgi:hypothetical protein
LQKQKTKKKLCFQGACRQDELIGGKPPVVNNPESE